MNSDLGKAPYLSTSPAKIKVYTLYRCCSFEAWQERMLIMACKVDIAAHFANEES